MTEPTDTTNAPNKSKFSASDVLKVGFAIAAVIGVGWLAIQVCKGNAQNIPMLPGK